jgi:ABC-2 type transport system ATP-binding protein
MSAITVSNLTKHFRRASHPRHGILGAVSQFLSPSYELAYAIRGLSFSIERGERVAFLGPNGAGKSTTIKILAGILRQSAGEVSVLGQRPIEDRGKLSYRVGSVFGNRTQLWYHLPAIDTFRLFAKVYAMERQVYEERLRALIRAFHIESLIDRPVRTLSLGERMRCEIVASILHKPEVLFLDEPTIGLDVTAKGIIREMLIELSERENITLLFTTHDMGDIERVCPRAIVINEGAAIFDGTVTELKGRYGRERIVRVHTSTESFGISMPGVTPTETAPYSVTLLVDGEIMPVPRVLAEIAARPEVIDIASSEAPLEEVIRLMYGEVGKNAGQETSEATTI